MVLNPFKKRTREAGGSRLSFLKKPRMLYQAGLVLLFLSLYSHTAQNSDKDASAPIRMSPKQGQKVSAAATASPKAPEKWSSRNSAVMGLATGYPIFHFKTFVGSLRATGYKGAIILGIASDAPQEVLDYLSENNVTAKVVEMAEKCTYNNTIGNYGKPVVINNCVKDYPDYKITWGRFALYRDWLLNDCPACHENDEGGVILTDIRDAYFQRDPFEVVTEHKPHPLMVFEESLDTNNEHWLTNVPVKACKDVTIGPTPVLCSGSTMGTRQGILDYLDVMIHEFDDWKTKKRCRIDMIGDDQSIHNYVYYANKLKDAIAIPHRTGPIHVVGYHAARIWEQAEKEAIAMNKTDLPNDLMDFYVKDKDQKWQEWLPSEFGLIDPKTGLITNKDGSPSAQVHQDDRFGFLSTNWMREMKEQNWPYNRIS